MFIDFLDYFVLATIIFLKLINLLAWILSSYYLSKYIKYKWSIKKSIITSNNETIRKTKANGVLDYKLFSSIMKIK